MRIEDVASVKPGKYLPKSEYVEDGPYWIYGSNSVMGRYSEPLVSVPHVVVAAVGAYAGAVRFSEEPSWVNNNAFALIPNDLVGPYFLYLWLDSALELPRILAGTGQPYVKRPALLAQEMPLPPLAVQRRIVDLMAHLDTHITNLEVERDSLVTARIAAAETLISNCDAAEVKLGDVLDIARGGSPRPIDDYFTEEPDGLNWIKIGDVPSDGRYITQTAQKIRKEGLSKTRAVRAGDFLLSNSMSFGRPYILKIDGCIHDGWLVLSDTRSQFNQEFLYYLLRSKSVQSQFISLAAGSGVKNLNIKVVRSVTIPLPDRQSQTEMAELLSTLFESADYLARELLALQRIRSQILSTLLCGDFLIRDSYDSLLSEVA